MPVWHVSISAWSPTGRQLDQPGPAELEAVHLLRGVGGDREWWLWSPARIGHLRVALTPAEAKRVPPGCVIADAGDSGPERERTR